MKKDSMTSADVANLIFAVNEATTWAKVSKVNMVVVHAPIEHAEDSSVFGYCPDYAARILYSFAMKGMGQENNPAMGIVAKINPQGVVEYV